MGEVSLLQNNDGIMDILVEEMHPHCHPRRCLSQTPLNGSVPRSLGGQEGHPVGTWLLTGGRGFPMPSPTCFLPMLCPHVARQQPEQHLLPVICALNPTPLHIPVGRPCSRHPSPVCCLRMRYRRLERAADHSDCLSNIVLQTHPVEQPYQGAEGPPGVISGMLTRTYRHLHRIGNFGVCPLV